MFIFHKSILFIYYKQVFRKINTKNGSMGVLAGNIMRVKNPSSVKVPDGL